MTILSNTPLQRMFNEIDCINPCQCIITHSTSVGSTFREFPLETLRKTYQGVFKEGHHWPPTSKWSCSTAGYWRVALPSRGLQSPFNDARQVSNLSERRQLVSCFLFAEARWRTTQTASVYYHTGWSIGICAVDLWGYRGSESSPNFCMGNSVKVTNK